MFYHAINHGVEKRVVFTDRKDLDRFTALLDYYRFKNPSTRFSFRKRGYAKKNGQKNPLVEIIAYCLMPDHFHILLKETEEKGISSFLSLVSNSYTKYFNARLKRSGPLFKGPFRATPVEEHNISHVSRHIHLNPFFANIVFDLNRFPFSSFPEYLEQKDGFCEKKYVLKDFENAQDYRAFVLDQEEYRNTKQALSKFYLD